LQWHAYLCHQNQFGVRLEDKPPPANVWESIAANMVGLSPFLSIIPWPFVGDNAKQLELTTARQSEKVEGAVDVDVSTPLADQDK
jgi:hypothetical protein